MHVSTPKTPQPFFGFPFHRPGFQFGVCFSRSSAAASLFLIRGMMSNEPSITARPAWKQNTTEFGNWKKREIKLKQKVQRKGLYRVRHQLTHSDVFFSVLGEVWPVLCNRGFVLQITTAREKRLNVQVHQQCDVNWTSNFVIFLCISELSIQDWPLVQSGEILISLWGRKKSWRTAFEASLDFASYLSTSIATTTAHIALVTENHLDTVWFSQGCSVCQSAYPPHRSTTNWPLW